MLVNWLDMPIYNYSGLSWGTVFDARVRSDR
jgi:hypothetical protein